MALTIKRPVAIAAIYRAVQNLKPHTPNAGSVPMGTFLAR